MLQQLFLLLSSHIEPSRVEINRKVANPVSFKYCLILYHIEPSRVKSSVHMVQYQTIFETSMFSTEKTAMLYIRNHKISELSVEFIATSQSKLLHLDVIYLPSARRKSFREKLPSFGETKRTLSGSYRVIEFQHKLAYTGKCKLCLLYGRFKPRSSSGTAVTPQGCVVSMLWMRGGMWRSRALIRIAV